MDKSIIEIKGINAVEEYLSDIGYIQPYLSNNDKTPMWDGSLFVYKSKDDFNKERFDYRVPVQVKASEFDGDVFPETTSFAIEVTDLKNYLNDGGLAFFKVLVKGKEKEVYCSFLTKPLIENIISKCKEQTTKSISLSKVPQNGNEVLENLKRIYILRDHSLLDLSVLENRSDYKFRFQLEHLSTDTNPLEYIATHFIDVLFSINGIPGEFYPKGGPVRLQLTTTVNKPVTIKGKQFFNCYKESYNEDGHHYYIGCIELVIPYKDAKVQSTTIHIKLGAKTLPEVINELEFILSFRNHKKFNVGEHHFDLSSIDYSTAPFSEWENSLLYWKDVERLFKLLKLEPSFDPGSLKEEDHKGLETLIHALVHGKVVYGDLGKNHLHTFHIGNQHILVYAEYLQERKFKLFDVYEHLSAAYTDDEGVRRPTPIHSLVFEQKELPSNIQLYKIVKTYKSYKKSNPQISLRANMDLLNILNHYDRCHDLRVLNAAIEIATWLKNEKNSAIDNRNITLLNYLQAIRRRDGAFNSTDKQKLYRLKTADSIENFARYILLDDKDKALSYLRKISEADLEFLKTLPIYHFMNE